MSRKKPLQVRAAARPPIPAAPQPAGPRKRQTAEPSPPTVGPAPALTLERLPVQPGPSPPVAPAAPVSGPAPAPSHLQALAHVIEIKHSLRDIKGLSRQLGELVLLWQSTLDGENAGLGGTSLASLFSWRGELDQLQYDPIDEESVYKAKQTHYNDAFLADVGSYLWGRYLAIVPPIEDAISSGRKTFMGRLNYNDEAAARFGQTRDQMKALIERVNAITAPARDELRGFVGGASEPGR
ncbi:hypothetical protein [Haliangium sp. UPWRP_2]|uniref:hypothetical protein n=1 Tax=Haliangium sp. UPWRP_2 TaxID=1931276 RepID=UPI000B5404A1|nr:hypothetical protein [Haliangium sp. UPWRP_2]PSM30771.1 hypothetical protein BVG81_008795 [Haliangium sp. UPWRP_2]